MLEFLKYFPLNLRYDKNPCTPRGASFKNAKSVQIKYQGNVVCFKAPRHGPGELSDRQIKPSSRDYDGVGLTYFNSGVMANDHWASHICFSRRWAFWAPWFSGPRGEVHMVISIVGRDYGHEYPDVSFLHPKMFENVLVDYLNDSYGHKIGPNGWPGYQGPLHWSSSDAVGIFAARFQIQQMTLGSPHAEPVRKLFFPVSDDRFIEISVRPSVTLEIDRQGNRIVQAQAMYDLCDSILESFKIQISEKTQFKLDKIKEHCPDMFLSKTFAPLKWPVGANSPPTDHSVDTPVLTDFE